VGLLIHVPYFTKNQFNVACGTPSEPDAGGWVSVACSVTPEPGFTVAGEVYVDCIYPPKKLPCTSPVTAPLPGTFVDTAPAPAFGEPEGVLGVYVGYEAGHHGQGLGGTHEPHGRSHRPRPLSLTAKPAVRLFPPARGQTVL
jgi:hypothetical protein